MASDVEIRETSKENLATAAKISTLPFSILMILSAGIWTNAEELSVFGVEFSKNDAVVLCCYIVIVLYYRISIVIRTLRRNFEIGKENQDLRFMVHSYPWIMNPFYKAANTKPTFFEKLENYIGCVLTPLPYVWSALLGFYATGVATGTSFYIFVVIYVCVGLMLVERLADAIKEINPEDFLIRWACCAFGIVVSAFAFIQSFL